MRTQLTRPAAMAAFKLYIRCLQLCSKAVLAKLASWHDGVMHQHAPIHWEERGQLCQIFPFCPRLTLRDHNHTKGELPRRPGENGRLSPSGGPW
jgi:hypothetical protein